MDHLFTCLGRRSKWDKKSSDVSLSKPKGECEKERDVEASDPPARFPFKFDLGSRDASQLNSTTRSSNEGKSTCKVDAISKRYLLPCVSPHNRQTQSPSSLKLDTKISFSDFSGQHLIHSSTQWVPITTPHRRKLCHL